MIEQLQDTILLQILGNLEYGIDRICLFLTCKTLLNKRDRVLTFNLVNKKEIQLGYKDQRDKQATSLLPLFRHSIDQSISHYHFITNQDQLNQFCQNNQVKDNDKEKQQQPQEIVFLVNRIQGLESKLELTSKLPNTIDQLYINSRVEPFNCGDMLPDNLKTLHYYFNESNIGSIPKSLETVELESMSGDAFNTLDVGECHNLKYLKLPTTFNTKLKKYDLPQSLEHLDVGFQYCHPFDEKDVLPSGLKELKLSYSNKFNPHELPSSLKSLELGQDIGLATNGDAKYPPGLERLDDLMDTAALLNQPITNNNLKYLHFNSHYNEYYPGNIGPNLEVLKFGYAFNQPLLNLPQSLKELELGSEFNSEIKLPENLERLNYHCEGLDVISFFKNYNYRYTLPKSLTTLEVYVSNEPDRIILEELPKQITTIHMIMPDYQVLVPPQWVKDYSIHISIYQGFSQQQQQQQPMEYKNFMHLDQLSVTANPISTPFSFRQRRIDENTMFIFSDMLLMGGFVDIRNKESLSRNIIVELYQHFSKNVRSFY